MEKQNKIILFYINAIKFGGSGRVLVNLANAFDKDGYKVLFVTTYKYDKEYMLNSDIIRIDLGYEKAKKSLGLVRNILIVRKLRALIRKRRPSICISFLPETNIRILLATSGLKIPTFISVRNEPRVEYENKIIRFFAHRLYEKATKIIFQTPEQISYFPSVIKNKGVLLFNLVKEDFYIRKDVLIRKNIVGIGRLTEQKNFSLLIDAFDAIKSDFPDQKLFIYGDGVLEKHLQDQVRNLNLIDRVFICKSVTNIIDYIFDAKAFVLTSNYEGMPNVLMEAMALGIPSITTDADSGGPRLLSDNGKYTFLIKKNNINELIDALKQILSNKETEQKYSGLAKQGAERFNPSNVFLEWKLLIESIDKA